MKKNDDIVDTIYACDSGFDQKNVVEVGKHDFIKLKLAVQAADEIVRLRSLIYKWVDADNCDLYCSPDKQSDAIYRRVEAEMDLRKEVTK